MMGLVGQITSSNGQEDCLTQSHQEATGSMLGLTGSVPTTCRYFNVLSIRIQHGLCDILWYCFQSRRVLEAHIGNNITLPPMQK